MKIYNILLKYTSVFSQSTAHKCGDHFLLWFSFLAFMSRVLREHNAVQNGNSIGTNSDKRKNNKNYI